MLIVPEGTFEQGPMTFADFQSERTFKVKAAGGEEFKDAEEELAAAIAFGVYLAGRSGSTELIQRMEGSTSTDGMLNAIDTYGADFVGIAGEGSTLAKKVEAAISAAMLGGAAAVTTTGKSLFANDEFTKVGVRQGLVYGTNTAVNAFYSDIMVPKLQREVERFATHGDRAKLFNGMNAFLQKNISFESPYWKVVANSAISRAHHYGMLRAAYESGKTGYFLLAVLDDKTTEICRALNGREFWVADGLNFMESVIRADDDEVRTVDPWITNVEQVEGKTTEQLRHDQILTPPFHSNCRTTLQII
jgi:hypothetical protein